MKRIQLQQAAAAAFLAQNTVQCKPSRLIAFQVLLLEGGL